MAIPYFLLVYELCEFFFNTDYAVTLCASATEYLISPHFWKWTLQETYFSSVCIMYESIKEKRILIQPSHFLVACTKTHASSPTL